MNDIVEGGGRHTRPRVDDTSFFRGYAAQTVADFAKDLCYWAIQPHPQPLPEGWADSYRRRLEELRGLVQRNFAGVGAVIRDLQQFEDDARELIVILHSDPQISMQPVQNWPIRAYQEAFERVMEWQQRFRQLAVKLNAQYEQTREELDQWRAANRQAAFSSDTGRNGRDELHDRNGVTGGGTSVLIQEPRDSGTRNMNSELNGIDGINAWLQQWWSRAGAIVANSDDSTPEDPWAWQGWLAAGVLRLPVTIGGESVAPLIEFLQGIIALWEPSETQGPKRTKSELWELSSRAWVTYNRLQVMIGKNQEGADVAAGGGTSADTVAEPVGAADAIGGGVYPDSSTVTAKQLAFHAGVTDREIRKQLKDSPYKTDNCGRKLFDYASALPVLRNWCEGTRTIALNSIKWPTLAQNLNTLRPERKKK